MSHEFSYSKFWGLLTSGAIGRPATNVFVVGYLADYAAIKYDDKTGRQRNFFHQGMQVRQLCAQDRDLLVLARPEEYRYGAYVVFRTCINDDERAKVLRAKELYIVDICQKRVPSTELVPAPENVFAADHFSFVVDTNEKNAMKRLRFHRTVYVPGAPEEGRTSRIFSPLPLIFDCPNTSRAFEPMLAPLMRPFGKWAHDVLTRHVAAFEPSKKNNIQSAGSRKQNRRRRQQNNNGITSFDDIWKNLPVHHMLIVAAPTNEASPQSSSYDVTVHVRTRNAPPGLTGHAYCFRAPSRNAASDETFLQAQIARLFQNVAWADMLPPRDLLNE